MVENIVYLYFELLTTRILLSNRISNHVNCLCQMTYLDLEGIVEILVI